MHKFTVAIFPFVFFFNCLSAQYNMENLSMKDEVAEQQYSFDKLRIYPITANRVFFEANKSVGNYKPLKSGLEDGTVKIIERGAITETQPNVVHDEAVHETVDVEALPTSQRILSTPAALPVDTNYRNFDGQVIAFQQYRQSNASHGQVNNLQVQQLQNNYQDRNINEESNYRGGGASDEVNKLYIQNNGKDSIFILAGEVVKGGKQDRVIAMDMVIPPHSEPIDLSVFCVEHGRWTYGGSADAQSDGFTGQASVANTSVRKAAIVNKDQSMVWSKVEEVTTANDAKSETGTLNALDKDVDYQKELQEYVGKFGKLPSEMQAVIGVVAVTGNRVIACDMFATPDLFRNAFPDLLKSYASEAITSGAKVTIKSADVDKYIANILDESKQKDRVEENGQMYRRGTKTLHISTF